MSYTPQSDPIQLMQDIHDLNTQIINLETEVRTLISQRDEAQTIYTDLSIEARGLRVQRDTVVAERDRLLVERAQLQAERDAAVSTLNDPHTSRHALIIRNRELKAERDNLQREFDETVQARDRALRDLATVRANWLDASDQLLKANRELASRKPRTIDNLAMQIARADHEMIEAFLTLALTGRDPLDFRLVQRTTHDEQQTWLEPK